MCARARPEAKAQKPLLTWFVTEIGTLARGLAAVCNTGKGCKFAPAGWERGL